MSDMQDRLSQLSPERRRLVFQKLQAQQRATLDDGGPAAPLTPVSRQRSLPLSFAQQRLWFLDQMEGESAHYNEFAAQRIAGPLDVDALAHSLTEIVRRHEILRTSFPMQNGAPQQRIAPAGEVALPVTDLQDLAAPAQEAEMGSRALAFAQQPFDLAHGPLLRVCLLQLAKKSHVLLLALHHIICDNWSTAIFVRELTTLYGAFSKGAPSPLPELPLQYADYAHWQRQTLRGALLEQQLAYWREQLSGAPALLELPSDHPRPPVQTFRGRRQAFHLDPKLTARLETLSQASGTTLFMTLLAAFAVLLQRYSGQEDIVVSAPIANRTQREIESLIGFFTNTLVLRTDLSGDPTFRVLLERVRQISLEAYAHQELPFEQLVEALQPERSLSYAPLFQVMFVFQNAPLEPIDLPDLTFAPVELEQGSAKFDLTLLMEASPQSLQGAFEYNMDLFETATVVQMSEHFQNLLVSVAANPEQPISQIPLLSATERRMIVNEWNNTAHDFPQELCLHQLFETQAARTPNLTAVNFEGQRLTYRTLNEQANQLANYLRKQGVGPGVLVGVCLDRSLQLVVGLLGVLKAGGAYVPLDPDYPETRLAFMLDDAQVAVLLTQAKFESRFPQGDVWLVRLDADREAVSQESDGNPDNGVSPKDLAYVLYTSGSTGQPKGVLIEHHSPVALVAWARRVFSPAQLAGVLASTSICFDLSIFELFTPLSWGGTVILAENALHLATLANAADVTLINTVPSAIAALLRSNSIPAGARTINLAGEPLTKSLVQQLYQLETVEQVFNLYGPSEDTTYSTFTLIEKSSSRAPHIGRPVDNTQVYILDERRQLVPIGVYGELYVGGSGVARGYLNRSELTADKFIPDPFRNEPRARLYRTGDLARYRANGDLEFLGRRDFQVKVRGYRIELGEIETALGAHTAVQESVVIAREDHPDEKQLVAYFVPEQRQFLTSNVLRDFLTARLPAYMIPAAFVQLDALPLTPNGKIDRRSLPAVAAAASAASNGQVAPRSPQEEILASIWVDVLHLERVGVHANFFELGGHSLLAMQVLSRLRDAMAVELPVRTVFEAPTIAALSQRVTDAREEGAQQLPPISPVSRDTALPLSVNQQRLWFLHQLEGRSAAYNIPLALRLDGALHLGALQRSLEEIVRRHEVLRTTFPAVDGRPAQSIAAQLLLQLRVVDLQGLPAGEREVEVRRLADVEAQRPFDLARGPLLRITLLRLAPEDHVVLLTIHHIVSDAWSLAIFVRELAELYTAYSTGALAALAELPFQYADYAHWQRQWVTNAALAPQIEYWREQLAGAPARLELPADRPRPAMQNYAGRIAYFQVSADLTRQLKAIGLENGATLYMTLLAAFMTLLARYSGQQDILVGSGVANRNRSEFESLIGFFVNTLVMRGDLSGDPTFRTLLARLRRVALQAYAHQDLPFEKLVEVLQPERILSHTPFFQVVFALQNIPLEGASLPGLSMQVLEMDRVSAKYDLTLLMEETDGGLTGSLEYNSDLFNAATIARLVGHFQALLTGIVADPGARLAELQLLTPPEREQLLYAWNDTRTAYPSQACIQQLFESQAARVPDAPALLFAGQQWSYGELNRRANQLAQRLLALGVGPETLVAICVERSPEMVVGLLGILKAGGAYVPLDPDCPSDRLAFMLDDTAAGVLLTQQNMAAALPAQGVHVICLDAEWPTLAQESDANPVCRVRPDNLAYVMYTSGSTGVPKGVSVPHRGVVRLVQATDYVDFSPQDVFLQFAPISFDAATFEIWGALLNGARLAIMPPEPPSLQALGSAIQEYGVTTLWLTAGLFSLMADQQLAALHAVRQLLAGGDVLSVPHVQKVARELPDCRLINGYGPTENTTFTCCYPVNNPDQIGVSVPIGRPIANTQVYVLDANMQPVPIGVPGELYIGGEGLARGYFNRPTLTAERFLPNPFEADPDARLYKTGDSVRYLPDGNIEFLGRLDQQVKIRGFRVELGEIESVLREHSTLEECIVLARQDQPGDEKIVAYIVSNLESPISVLKNYLQRKLPAYMLPSAYVALAALPLTPNGKVDRQALPAPDFAAAADNPHSVTPRTPAEQTMADIWAEVLGRESIGVHDDFFAAGGHSLLATQVISRVRTAFQVELPLSDIFEAPTVGGLVERVESMQRGAAAPYGRPAAADAEEQGRL